MESPKVQEHQHHWAEYENGDRCDGNRHGCESGCAVSTNDGCVGDCAMDDDGANETSRAAGNGQRRDNCHRGIEKTLRRRKEEERGKKLSRERLDE